MIKIAFIPGDGIGPEIVDCAIEIVNRAIDNEHSKIIQWDKIDLDYSFSDKWVNRLKKYNHIIKGPSVTPIGCGHYSANVKLRESLALFVSLRRFENIYLEKMIPEIDLVSSGTDCVYSGLEISRSKKKDDEVFKILEKRFGSRISGIDSITLRTFNQFNVEKLAQFARKYADEKNISKISVIHKADIMKVSDGDFLSVIRKHFCDMNGYEEIIAGPFHTNLVQNPSRFRLLITSNLLRCTISHTLAGIYGGIAFGPGCNIGDSNIVYESTHGAAPTIARKNVANPVSMILSSCLMLENIGLGSCAGKIKSSIRKTIAVNKIATPDIASACSGVNPVGQREFIDTIIKNI